MKITNLISPSVLTAANLFFGFLAIIKAFDGDYSSSAWLIMIAAVMDGLDGKLARFMKKGSEFGIQYDSLADMASFGVAPAVLVYTAYFDRFGFLGAAACFSIVLAGSLRLAKFNLSATRDTKEEYAGLPIPLAAVTIASFLHFSLSFKEHFSLEIYFFPLMILLSLLMVSAVKYDTFPKFTFKESSKNKVKLIFLVGSIILIALWPARSMFPLCVIVISQGIIRSLIRTVKAVRNPVAEKIS